MNNSTDLVISTENLTKSFKGVNALKSLNLKVPKNSIFGFLGPNGAGKTTAIKLLLGLARPTDGRATIVGLDAVRDSVAVRERVGYLAQDPRYYESMTARETLRYTADYFYSGPANAIEERIDDTLELVGLADKADRPIKGFSGGERQRLGIAQAQINYPDLLILDEPAAALDPMGRHDVLEVMERLRKHTTIFYSTHILSDVQRVSDTVAILDRGELVAQAPIEELLGGGKSTTYSVVVKGSADALRTRVSNQSWVTSVNVLPGSNGQTAMQVSVSDEATAEAELPPLIVDDRDVTLIEYGLQKQDLEEVFMSMVEGHQNGS
ncbi:MAG: ABC transporter ATP-binding protein [Anaerolineae bacterium]